MNKLPLIALPFLLASCGDDSGDDDTKLTQGPGAFAADYKTSPNFHTQMSTLVSGQSPHKAVQIWYSANIKPALGRESLTAPKGTVAIKEFDNKDGQGQDGSDGTVDGIAVMIKREAGYDSDNGDWYYQMRDASGAEMSAPAPGKIAPCIQCHRGFKGTDYLGGLGLK